MDIKLTQTEYALTDKVLKWVQDEIKDRYDLIYKNFMSKHPDLSSDMLKVVQDKFTGKREVEKQLNIQLVKKISILLHFYRVNGNTEVSLLELLQQVFLEDGDDFKDIKKRQRLLEVMKYFAASQDVQLLYAITDKKGKILFVQMPDVSFSKNKVKIGEVNLLGNGDYEEEKIAEDRYFCYLPEHRDDGVTLSKDNIEDYTNIIYLVNTDPDILFEESGDGTENGINRFTIKHSN